MRSFAIIAGLAALAIASPAPQIFDPSDLDDIEPAAAVTVPLGVGSQTLPFDASAASASAYAETAADPSPDVGSDSTAALSKRSLARLAARGNCAQQPLGYGDAAPQDNAASFLGATCFAATANNAQTPAGWVQTFVNQQASVSACSYMGYKTYKSYDVNQAAADCKAITGCKSFNIFFERDPTLDPGPNCPNPPSTTVIKASFWGVPIGLPSATNKGQWRNNFQVVIAGSNAYQLDQCIEPVPNYNPNYLGSCTINAPKTDCNAYLTAKFWTDGFDQGRCAAACDAVTAQSPDTPCRFYTTYVQMKNGAYQFQACALYKRAFDNSYW